MTYLTGHETSGLRPYDDIDAVEFAKYYKAKRITDNKKLAAMLPSWIKRELWKPPEPVKYDFSQIFPSHCLPPKMRPAVRLFPASHLPMADYIRTFHTLNGHKE